MGLLRRLSYLGVLLTFLHPCHIVKARPPNDILQPVGAPNDPHEPIRLSSIISVRKPTYCDGTQDWFGREPSRVVANCLDADAMMQRSWPYGFAKHETLPWDTPSQHHLPVIHTPVRFTAGKSR